MEGWPSFDLSREPRLRYRTEQGPIDDLFEYLPVKEEDAE